MVSKNNNNNLTKFFWGQILTFDLFDLIFCKKRRGEKIQSNFVIIFCGCQTSKVLQIYAYVTLVSIWNNKKSGGTLAFCNPKSTIFEVSLFLPQRLKLKAIIFKQFGPSCRQFVIISLFFHFRAVLINFGNKLQKTFWPFQSFRCFILRDYIKAVLVRRRFLA